VQAIVVNPKTGGNGRMAYLAAWGSVQKKGGTVAKKGTAGQAKAYLNFLYSDAGQENAAQHAIRPSNAAILKKYASTFKPIQLFAVDEFFGSFAEAQKLHFNDGGQFDKLYTVK
jgi:sulfate transport system substrate-binding protein